MCVKLIIFIKIVVIRIIKNSLQITNNKLKQEKILIKFTEKIYIECKLYIKLQK